MEIKKFREGDYATYLHSKTTWVAQMSDDSGSYKESVSLPKGEIERNGNLYTLMALGDDIEGTLRESSGIEIKFYEKTLADYEKAHPEIFETPKQELKGIKVVGHVDLNNLNQATHPKPATKEEKQEQRAKLSREEKFGITGYSPKNREVVLYRKKFAGESFERSGIAIAYDENHFYVVSGLYGDYNSFTTIADPHPDGLAEGTFPRGTALSQVSPGMAPIKLVSDVMMEKFKDDMDKYDALVKQRELEEKRKKDEEQRKKDEEERIAQLKKDFELSQNECPVPDEKLIRTILGLDKPNIETPNVPGEEGFSNMLTGLSRFYYDIADSPKVYSLSPAYVKNMMQAYDNNLHTMPMKGDIITNNHSAVICVKVDSNIITIPFRIGKDTIRFSAINNANLITEVIFSYDRNTFDFAVTNQWFCSKQRRVKRQKLAASLLHVILAFLYDKYTTLDFLRTTSVNGEEYAKAKANFLLPKAGELYVERRMVEELVPTDGTVKETKVESYSQIKWKRVEGFDELQPVRSQVSGYTKVFANPSK